MKITTSILALAALPLLFASAVPAAVETYVIDKVHSSVGFSIRHFVAKVPGTFGEFNGTITVDRDNLEKSTVEATIDVNSVDTKNQKRDDHLRGADFFEVAKYPKMTFKSTSWKKVGEIYEVAGNLTLKDVTKPVVLKVAPLGFAQGMQGPISGWEATTTINKKEFNVKDPAMLDAALGDDVTITINVEAGLKKS